MDNVDFNKIMTCGHKLGISSILAAIVVLISGCGTAFITSKQDNLLSQIDVWSAANEYGKAFSALDYVKASHPQYQQLQDRKKNLLIQATGYEQHVDQQIQQYINGNQWSQALDLLDQAKEKYPLDKNTDRGLVKTEKSLFDQQHNLLQSLDQTIMLERSQLMIKTRLVYEDKLKIDPRNKALKKQLENLNKEAKILSQKLTLLSQKAINKKHYITARTRINQAIALDPGKDHQKILSQLQRYEKKYSAKKKKTENKAQEQDSIPEQTAEIQQNTHIEAIEKSYNSGDFAKARQLLDELDENEQNTLEFIRLKQKLDRSINYSVEKLLSKANKQYTDGQFHQAIEHWLQVLSYDPENSLAKKNIQRAEKVINKLSDLREKQQN